MTEFWMHQFTKDGPEIQIGEQPLYDNTMRKIMAQRMICVHCGVEYMRGKDAQPSGKCPARSDKREMKRILG